MEGKLEYVICVSTLAVNTEDSNSEFNIDGIPDKTVG